MSLRSNANAFAVVCLLLAAPAAALAAGLQEELLESKHRRGDYGVYLGWYDPDAPQFDVHGSSTIPFGVKARFRALRPFLRFEFEASYYRKGSAPNPFVSAFAAPEFDGFSVYATAAAELPRLGPIRPYVGGGPVFVSLANDFIVAFPEIDPSLPSRLNFGSWSELDFGLQAVAGFDVRLGGRAFPFVEYRHLLGELTIDEVLFGGFSRSPESLEISDKYDYSGPYVMVGLRVLF